MLKEFSDFIAFDTIIPFDDVSAKQELSGTIVSANSAYKTVLVYDRINGELIKTTNSIQNDTFLLKCPFRNDSTLTVVCRDEGGDFNADIYDQLSLCTVNYSFPSEAYFMVEEAYLSKRRLVCFVIPSCISAPYTHEEQDHKGIIFKFVLTNSIVEYQESNNTPVIPNYSNGMGINDEGYVDNETVRFSSDTYSMLFDIFGDGSADVLWLFNPDLTTDVSGNYSFFNNRMLRQRGIGDLGGYCISNLTYMQSYTERINFKYDYTPGDTTISCWIYLGQSFGGSSPIARLLGGFNLYTNTTGTYIYFQTAATNTTWNAAKSWSVGSIKQHRVHISIAFGDGFYSLYLNGILVSTQAGLNTAAGLDSTIGSLCFFDYDYWYSYTWPGSIQNFRILNKVIDSTEAQTLYAERLIPTGIVNNITGHSFDSGISPRRIIHTIGPVEHITSAGTLEHHNNVDLLMSFDGNSLGENSGMETILDNVSMFGEYTTFDGVGLFHKAPLSSDTSGNYAIGSESNLDVLCKFKPTRTNADEIFWKSGDSVNGLAVGIKSGAVGIYGASASTLSSITMPVSNLTVGEWHYLYATNSVIKLTNVNGLLINEVSGTVTAGNGIAQESVGGASEGSPMTASSSGELEHFIGDIDRTSLYEHSSSLISKSLLKIAATVEGTKEPCIIEEQLWNPVSNLTTLWVTIPDLSSTVDNKIRLFLDKNHWDNPNVSFTGVAPTIPGGASVEWTDLRTAAEADTVASFIKGITGGVPILPDWNGANKIQLTLTPHTVYATNIPVRVHLTNSSEVGIRLMESLVKDGVFEYKKLAIEVGDTKVQAYAEVELASYSATPKYPTVYDTTTVKAIDYLSASYYPWFAVDPSKSLIGTITGTTWFSKNTVLGTLERTSFKFNVDLGTLIQLKQIVLENTHHNGGHTYHLRAIRKFKLYGTNSATAFENLDYFDETDLTFLGKYHARKHITTNISDPQTFEIEDNYLFFRYYVIRIENGYTALAMGFRDIDFIGVEATLDLNILVPIYSDVVDTILNLYPDITQADNTTYVDDPGTPAALEVWNHGYVTAVDEQSRVSIAHDPVFLSDYVQRTWGEGQVVTMTVPASAVGANMVDFPFPVYLSTSSGTNSFDFSEWFVEMRKDPILMGSEVKNYSFGALENKENNFYTDNMNFSVDESQNGRGIFEFDNDQDKHIQIKYTEETKFLAPNTSFTFWIEMDRSSHNNSVYYGIMGTGQNEGFSIYLYNNGLYFRFSNGTNYATATHALENVVYGSWIHVTLSIRPYIAQSNYIEIKINGEYKYQGALSYSLKMGDFWIGGLPDRADSFYGRLHSIQLWDKWLSDDEAKSIMNTNNPYCPVDTISTSVLYTIPGQEVLLGESLTSIQVISENNFTEASFSISFDRLTYQIYVEGAWVPIVSKSDTVHGNAGNTDWFYYHWVSGWIHSGTLLATAISSAVEHSLNWMNYIQISALTQTEFNLKFITTTGICDIAVSVRASSHLDDSMIDSIIINDTYTTVSELFLLDDYNTIITSSRVQWRKRSYEGVVYTPTVSALLNGETSWTVCTNNSTIPGIVPGMNTVGRSIIFKIEWPYSTPEFVDREVTLDVTII